jgi:hypothetical protein
MKQNKVNAECTLLRVRRATPTSATPTLSASPSSSLFFMFVVSALSTLHYMICNSLASVAPLDTTLGKINSDA